jgi:hypothetical protein
MEWRKMLQLHMIPSSGDATLLRFCEDENEVNILIDGGNRKSSCINYLNKLRLKRVDLLIGSHLDEDHIRGLREVADEIDVGELWITNISMLIQPAKELGSLYMLKCLFETSMIVDSPALQGKDKRAVYEGYERQIGPFHLQVLSPPKSLHNYLGRPDVIKRILESRKGQTIVNYVRKLIEDTLEKSDREEGTERRKEIVSEVVKRFEVDTPQLKEIKERIDSDEYDPTWQEDKYYESARSLFNDISIVISITYNYHGMTKRFLFPGDLTNWSIVMARYPQQIRNSILKVPHHGSEIYFDLEAYNGTLFDRYLNSNLRARLPQPYLDLLREWLHTALLLEGRMPSLNDLYFGFPLGGLRVPCNDKDVFEWLAPERALIYPLMSHNLPNPDVRNKIINASDAMCCAFKQGSLDKGKHARDSCISYYNCTERDSPVVFEWKRARGSSWAARLEEHSR